MLVVILSQFTALDWSAGDERELLMRANVDGRCFFSIFILCLFHAYMRESKKGTPSSRAYG